MARDNKPMSPLDSILGRPGDKLKCVDKGVMTIHWFDIKAKIGDKCLCGKTTKQKKK